MTLKYDIRFCFDIKKHFFKYSGSLQRMFAIKLLFGGSTCV